MSTKKKKPAEKKAKAKLSDDEIFDKFVEFLQSPIWQLPVVSFIEQRSISWLSLKLLLVIVGV